MTTATMKLNGVDVAALTETIEAIEADPTLARFEFRNRNRWLDGGHNRSTVQGFYGAGREDDSRVDPFVFDADEPPILLGGNRGANPVEFILHAMVGCLTTSLVYFAAAQGVKIDAVESTLEGEIDLRGFLGLSKEVPVGYESIQVTMRVESEAPESKIRELVGLAQMRSPAFNSVVNPIPTEVRAIKA